ncbi:glycosyltransferase [Streptomyces sp. WAC01280]|uniref:glycosyltransferase n=1 Tax=Streptomyces sp. WAC01280 TaxID=2487424 RepID=UPI00163C8709|nr:glycosyltransferase [Streptomyces sp. WAC01280]
MEKITVITLSRGRPELLRRSIESVRRQDYAGPVEHLVVIDDCERTAREIADEVSASTDHRRVTAHLMRRAGDGDGTGGGGGTGGGAGTDSRAWIYPRISRLLNKGAALADSTWISFLDDDNEYRPDHLRGLMALVERTGYSAVHSARSIHWADGSPYLEPRFPWAHVPGTAEEIYELMCARGIWVRGTNVLRDRAVPIDVSVFRNSTIMTSRDAPFLVDQNIWLMRRDLMLAHPIPDIFSERDLDENMGPDDMQLKVLLSQRIPIASTGEPTVRYYLGGVSNNLRPVPRR